MRPPFDLTPRILNLASEISLLLGRYEGLHAPIPQPQLRRQNRVKTIHSSLAIEGNTLNLEQITAIFERKRVRGPKRDILEVENAIHLYDSLNSFNPISTKDLLKAHGILMKGLAQDAGKFRTGGVGILKGSKVSHVAPSAKRLPQLIDDLFNFLKTDKEFSMLVKACVFHYELEFIHPFSDGNGRMGRFWQSVILTRHHAAFEYIPVESLVRARQDTYYRVLEQCDKKGTPTSFIEFSLETIRDALLSFLTHLKPTPETPESRLMLAQTEFQNLEFTRGDYLRFFKRISTATGSRDLALGTVQGLLLKIGTKAVAKYRFKLNKG